MTASRLLHPENAYAPIDFTASPIEPGLNEINIVVHCVNSLLNLLLFLAAAVFVARYFFDEAPEVPALARLRRRISNSRPLSDTRRGDSTSV